MFAKFQCSELRRMALVTAAMGVLGLAGAAQGSYITITMDGNTSDWSGVPRISDPIGDGGGDPDISQVAVANDGTNLYFLLRVDDSGGKYFGSSGRVHYLTVLLDTDNNTSTGTLAGPTGQQVGVEYSLYAARRHTAAAGGDTSYAGQLWSGDAQNGGTYTNEYFGDAGLPKTAENGGVNEVNEFEMMVPLAKIGGIGIGDTIGFTVRASRSGATPGTIELQDWLNTAQTYTLSAVPEPASLALLGLGGVLMLRRRGAKSEV